MGYWGPNLVRNYYSNDSFEIKWASDLLDSNLDKIKKDYPSIKLTKNYFDILRDPKIKVVVVATPPKTHYSICKQCLEANKNVWIEKPFTTSYADASELVNIAKQKKLTIFVDFPFIFYGPIIKIKEILRKNHIGNLFYYESLRTNLGLVQKDVNAIWDLAPHDLSILGYLFPNRKIKSVYATGITPLEIGKEQLSHVILKYEDGFNAHINVSWISPVKMRLIMIGGDKKMIMFDDIVPSEKIKIYNRSIKIEKNEITAFNPVYRSGNVLIPALRNKEALKVAIEEFANILKGKKKNNPTIKIALNSLRILEASSISLKQNKEVEIINQD